MSKIEIILLVLQGIGLLLLVFTLVLKQNNIRKRLIFNSLAYLYNIIIAISVLVYRNSHIEIFDVLLIALTAILTVSLVLFTLEYKKMIKSQNE